MDIYSTYPPSNRNHSTSCLVDRSGSVAAIKTVIVAASTLSILGALIIIIVSYCKGETRKRNDTLGESTVLQSPTALQTNGVEIQADVRKDDSRKEKVRHPARLIIACISAADIIVAISHIWGVTNNYVPLEHASSHYTGAAENAECGAQAVLSIFGAISSFLWSDLLAFMAVVMYAKKRCLKPALLTSYRAFVVYNIVCWGIPLLIVCVLGGKDAIGFQEGVDVGWCYIHVHNNSKRKILGWMFFSYDLWVLGSMVFILWWALLFWIIFCANRLNRRRMKEAPAEERQQLLESVVVDENAGCCKRSYLVYSKPMMMIIAANLLILLRVWSIVLDFLIFPSNTEKNHFRCTTTNLVILCFAGIGNSAQGLVNFFIFIVLTGQGLKFVRSLCKKCKKNRPVPH